MLIFCCLELKAKANLLFAHLSLRRTARHDGSLSHNDLINLSFPPRKMSVPPSYPSFFWSNEGGRNSKTERWEQGESNDATALWALTHTPCRAPITPPLINRANPSKCGVCGQMCMCVCVDWPSNTHTYIHTFTAGIAQLDSLLHLQTNFPHQAPEMSKDMDYLLH